MTEDLVAKLDALYFDAPVRLGTPDYRDFWIQMTTDYPQLRAIVVAAQEYVEARTTGTNQEVGAAERELFAAVRGEA